MMSMISFNQHVKDHIFCLAEDAPASDVHADNQRMIDASVHWYNYDEPQGQFQINTDEEKKHIINAMAKDFEGLLERLEMRDQELCQLEQAVFPTFIHPYESLSHHVVAEQESPTVRQLSDDVGWQNSLLVTQELIRPLYCYEQADLCHYKNDFLLKELTMSRQKKKKLLERLKRVPKPKADTPLTGRNIPKLGYLEEFKRTLHERVYLRETFLSTYKVKPKISKEACGNLHKLQQQLDSTDKVSAEIFEIGALKQIQPHTGYETMSKVHNIGTDCRSICVKNNLGGVQLVKQSKTEVMLILCDTSLTVKVKFPPLVDSVSQRLMNIANKASSVRFHVFLEGRVPSETMQGESSSVQSILSHFRGIGGFYILLCVGLQIYRLGVTVLDGTCYATSFLCKPEQPQFLGTDHRRGLPWWGSEHDCLSPAVEENSQISSGTENKCSRKGKCHLVEYYEEDDEPQVFDEPKPIEADLDGTLVLHKNVPTLQREEDVYLQKIVVIQATVRGYLARQRHKAEVEYHQKRICILITKVQACWRSWKLRRLYQIEYRMIVTVQAHVRGFLARRRYRTYMMEAKERMIYHLVSRVQACWRGRKTRVSDILRTLYLERKTRELSVIKIQAVWRGIRTRRRFLDAVKNSKYNDSDEFDYSPVNDADFLPMKLDFDESIDLNEEVDCSKGQGHLLDHHRIVPKLAAFPPRDAHVASEECTKTLSGREKHQLSIIDERKSAVAEIAKDWGFKEERTALQFLRALENTRRRGEPQKIVKTDSPTQLKARNERDRRISLRTSQHTSMGIAKQTLKSSAATTFGIF